MKRVCLFLADGFEDVEVVLPIDILRRGGVHVDIAGVTGDVCTSAHGLKIVSDIRINDIDDKSYDLFFAPGGAGAFELRDNERVITIFKTAAKDKKWLTAICAAPIVLERAGILSDKTFTMYPTMKDDITIGKYVGGSVVVDGNVVTGEGPGAAGKFGLKLLELLMGKNTADKVKSDMLLA